MRELGEQLEVIQRRLGHASIRTTADIYGSLPERVDRAVADQLNDLFTSGRGADVVQASNRVSDEEGSTHRELGKDQWR